MSSPLSNPLKRVRTFAAMSRKQRLLLAEAGWFLGRARLAVLLRPFRDTAKNFGDPGAESAAAIPATAATAATDVRWGVATMARILPWHSTCLVRAIAGQAMLRRRKIACSVYLGLTHDENGELTAHAWLRCGDLLITGGAEAARYKVLTSFADES